ncbi:MAG: amine dehydrogenase large subunit, partial [Proteobacteria bacterium]|nr:amine dehydrogenase large subunit [Pseudomonadota bacterium]
PSAATLVFAAVFAFATSVHAGEPLGQVATLPAQPGPHWVWVSDILLKRAALVDADGARFLGMLPGGSGILAPLRSRDGREIYQAETYYARGTRGQRTDVVSIADAITLQPKGEVVIPPKRSEHTSWVAGSALSDDGRFVAVFNLNPGTSLSIVDVAERRFVGEIETPGCGLVYAAGPRRFLSLCADGTALVVTLDESGRPASKLRTERWFDPQADPITEKAARRGDQWFFVSFEGFVHPIDVSGEALRFADPWPLLSDADRKESWRVGGMQQLALHGATGRLYALMHQGGADTHKDPGTEVFVYDVDKRERVQRIELRNQTASFVLDRLGMPPGGTIDWLLQRALPNEGAERIAVTQDDAPVLLAATAFPATLAVYDARSGEYLRDVSEVGIATNYVAAP